MGSVTLPESHPVTDAAAANAENERKCLLCMETLEVRERTSSSTEDRRMIPVFIKGRINRQKGR
ncbi:hypothetical protein RBSH_06022 [Rhodopirellula baltica SH28]|uniref:Uncharacterized protein n=1 Tax=Rhodopirellula baltica SH28 TaxID=993517 RepID=K5D8D2_RHOBT|nr:hypothetical protein RBSH_06022 [Rhodopirellula baltica SH28]